MIKNGFFMLPISNIIIGHEHFFYLLLPINQAAAFAQHAEAIQCNEQCHAAHAGSFLLTSTKKQREEEYDYCGRVGRSLVEICRRGEDTAVGN